VVLPDDVLFESGIGKQMRAEIMDKGNPHAIVRLPTGIFYAQGVKTNVPCFTCGEKGRFRRFSREHGVFPSAHRSPLKLAPLV